MGKRPFGARDLSSMEGQEIQDDLSGPGDFSARLLEVDGQVVAHTVAAQPNKSLDASGGSVFRIIVGPAMLD